MRFKLLVTGWNCYRFVERSLRSIAAQRDPGFDVCVVDDASDDPRQPELVRSLCDAYGWHVVLNEERKGALFNLHHAAHVLEPEPTDVLVFVDLDDRLVHADVLGRLRSYYETFDPLMTYGSYVCDPHDDDVAPAREFPMEVVDTNSYRAFSCRDEPDPIWFNHLRSVRFDLFDRLDPARDFTFPDGTWFQACYDTAIMIPSFELAGGRYVMIPEVLYLYTRDNPLSDCRVSGPEVDAAHRQIFSMPPRDPIGPIVRPPSVAEVETLREEARLA